MPDPGAGTQTSLDGSVASLSARLQWRNGQRRAGGATPGKGAPILSYSYGTGNNQSDITQFADVFQPSGGQFAPGYPLVPVEPEAVRSWDFPVNWNVNYTPRSYEPISFAQLRALAENHDITRLCIETRKDQVQSLDWQIKSRDTKKPKAGADARAKTVTEFWRKPDGYHCFEDWLRELLEDVFVPDAATIELRYNRGGDIIALDLVDGTTIKVLLDDTGRRPVPPAPGYEQIIHGRPWVLLPDGQREYTEDQGRPLSDRELIYMPRNPRVHKGYGFSPVEQILTTVNIGLRRQVKQLRHFTDGNIPAGLINAPDNWSSDQLQRHQLWFDSMLVGNLGRQTQLIWGPAGSKYTPFTEEPYKDSFDEWLARITCFAFSLPPTAFTPQVNRATAETAQDVARSEGLAPILGWVKRLVDHVIQERQGQPDLEFAWQQEKELDAETQSKVIIGYCKEGILTRNEGRDQLGMDKVEGGDDLMVDTPSGPMLLSDIAAASALMANPPPPPPSTMPRSDTEPGGGVSGGTTGGGKPAPAAPGKKPAPAKGKPAPATKPPAKAKKASRIESAYFTSILQKAGGAGSGAIDPANARPIDLPIASEEQRAQVDHIAWQRVQSPDFALVERVVPLSDIVATQDEVDGERVDQHAQIYREQGRFHRPPVVLELDGSLFIVDGHHRCEAIKQLGGTALVVSSVEGDEQSPGVDLNQLEQALAPLAA